jgi:uncharacterized membrane protein
MNAIAGWTRRMRVRRAASRVWDSLWFVPAVYVLVALGLSVGLVRWDQADPIVLTRHSTPPVPPQRCPRWAAA